MVRSAVTFLIGVAFCAGVSAAQDDPIKVKLDAARVDYDAKMEKLKKGVNEWLDKREDTARKAGNKAQVDQIKAAREIYEEYGVVPINPPADLKKLFTSAQTGYDEALASAVKEYTKAKKDDEAAAVQKKLKEFREGEGATALKRALLGTWHITVGKFEADWTFKEDGTVSSTAGGVKEGKWGFDPSRNAILIVWGKDLTDKFDLPLNPKGTVGSQVGRQNMRLDAVKKDK